MGWHSTNKDPAGPSNSDSLRDVGSRGAVKQNVGLSLCAQCEICREIASGKQSDDLNNCRTI